MEVRPVWVYGRGLNVVVAQRLHSTLRPLGDQPMYVVLPGGPIVCRSVPLRLIVKPKFGKTCPTTILPFRPGTTLAPTVPLLLAATIAGPSNTTAAPAATTARRIRPRIAAPQFLLDAGCQPARVTVDKPGSGACHPRRALRGNLVLPAPLRQAWHGGQISVKRPDLQVCPGFILAFALAGWPTGAAACCPAALAVMPRPLASVCASAVQ